MAAAQLMIIIVLNAERIDIVINSFYPDSVNSWNNIGPELRSAGNCLFLRELS